MGPFVFVKADIMHIKLQYFLSNAYFISNVYDKKREFLLDCGCLCVLSVSSVVSDVVCSVCMCLLVSTIIYACVNMKMWSVQISHILI